MIAERYGEHAGNGLLLYEARKKLGMTQAAVANAAGMNPRQLSRLEKGLHLPSRANRDRLAEVLELDPGLIPAYGHDPEDGPLPVELAAGLMAWLQRYIEERQAG